MRSATASPSGPDSVVRPNGPFGASCSFLVLSPVSLLVRDLPRKDLFDRDGAIENFLVDGGSEDVAISLAT